MSRRHTGISWEQVHGKKKVKPFLCRRNKRNKYGKKCKLDNNRRTSNGSICISDEPTPRTSMKKFKK